MKLRNIQAFCQMQNENCYSCIFGYTRPWMYDEDMKDEDGNYNVTPMCRWNTVWSINPTRWDIKYISRLYQALLNPEQATNGTLDLREDDEIVEDREYEQH